MKTFFYISILFLIACSEEIVHNGDPKPQITFVSLSKQEVVSFKEELEIVVNYIDGDGDLGSPDADSLDIYVKDSRLKDFDRYHLKPLAPLSSNIRIQGQLNIKLKTLFVLSSLPMERANFEVYIKDRAGNKSNTIITPFVNIINP